MFASCRRLGKDREGHPLPVNLNRLIVNAQKRFSIDPNQVSLCWSRSLNAEAFVHPLLHAQVEGVGRLR